LTGRGKSLTQQSLEKGWEIILNLGELSGSHAVFVRGLSASQPVREKPMRIARTMLASAAALGLAAAPVVAQAAPARASTPVAQNEEIAGGGTFLYVALAAAAVALVVIFANDDENDLPSSP
jgi:hypothetical protein